MFGSHLSIAGGLHNALLAAERLGHQTTQIFTRNQKQWRAPPLRVEAIRLWTAHCRRLKFRTTVSHDSYLINLASPDPRVRRRSVAAAIDEHHRCNQLGIPLLVMHPGAHLGEGEAAGIRRIVEALNQIHEQEPGPVLTCLEITAGQGTTLGYRLEHLAEIIGRVRSPRRMAVCLDTAHLLAAGYDFRGRKYRGFCRQVQGTVGLDRVKVWHLNDSKSDLGSRVDRHQHIGLGYVGLEGFRPIVRDGRWREIPKILETPKEGRAPDGREWDAFNLERLRSLQ
ncbi:MAG: deoxyribonuclease IV [Phycisphaerales bacterium]|nr:deoxyribonuclease IV [Phycisphaerales bacterium]